MDALVKTEAGKGLKLMQVPVPEPKMGEVLIKIRKTAICGTDVHIYNWDPWAQQHIHPAMTIGHEYVGEIAQLGEGVKELYVGQRVSGEGHIVCGHCRNCRSGNGQWCAHTKGVGVDRDGAFAARQGRRFGSGIWWRWQYGIWRQWWNASISPYYDGLCHLFYAFEFVVGVFVARHVGDVAKQ